MTIHRREFMQTTLGAAAAMTFASRVTAADTADIRIAVIGFRGQGGGHIRTLGKRVVALCDVDDHVLQRKVDELKERNQTVDAYNDYRKLLERQDIDAVSIATPNHLHAIITIAAVQAGKHVYCEKPASHNVWEGRQMVAAARYHKKIVQLGTQARSSQALRDAHEWLHAGNLGAIKYVVGTCYKRRESIGKSDTPLEFPSYINRDLWTGPAADQPIYRPKRNSQGGENPHYDWHWDFNTGGGDLGNQGIHQMDVARWFLGAPGVAPRVISIGGRLGYEDAGNTANTQIVFHAYEKAPLMFEVRGLPRGGEGRGANRMDNYRGAEIGDIVQCEKGCMLLDNSYRNAVAFDLDGQEIKRFRGGGGHHDNWLEAIVANDPKMLHADIHEGHLSSALCHTGNVSYRLGKKTRTAEIAETVKENEVLADGFSRMCEHLKANGVDIDSEPAITMGPWLEVDPKTEQFVGNDAAAELWTRKYREPFVVPDMERQLGGEAVAAG
jgi:predicted dehydrogenase